MRLDENGSPVLGKHVSVTMDNWYSSLKVAQQLFDNGLTIAAIVRKDKRDIVGEFRVAKGNPAYYS